MKIYIIIQVGVQICCPRSPHASVTELLPNFPGPGKSTVGCPRGGLMCANMLQPRSAGQKWSSAILVLWRKYMNL